MKCKKLNITCTSLRPQNYLKLHLHVHIQNNYKTIHALKYVQALSTLVPLKSMSLIKGNIPRMMSAPLLSTNMAAHLWGFPLIRLNQASKSSNNQGRSRRENETELIMLHVHVITIQTCYFSLLLFQIYTTCKKQQVGIVSTHQYISECC